VAPGGRNKWRVRGVIGPMSEFRSAARTILPTAIEAAAAVALVLGLLPALLAAAAAGL
jgi:hypothetical protein